MSELGTASDVAGEVVEVGPGMTNFKAGYKVFFFLISKGRYIKKKNSAPYIGNVLRRQKHQETKLQRSNKAGRDKQEKAGKTKHHSRRVRKKKDLNSRMDRSRPSKLLAFRSLQIHHIKQ